MDESAIYRTATSDAVWVYDLCAPGKTFELNGTRGCTPSQAAYETLHPVHGWVGKVTFRECDSDFFTSIELACSGGMTPTFSCPAGPGEFSVTRVINYDGCDADLGCRYWEVLPSLTWEAMFLRWEGKTAVCSFPKNGRSKVSPPPFCGLYRFGDLILREDIAAKFLARGWTGIQLEPVEFVKAPRGGEPAAVFKEKYFRLCTDLVMPRRHGLMSYTPDSDLSTGLEEEQEPDDGPSFADLQCNLNGIIDAPRVFATDEEPGGDLARSRECDLQVGGECYSHRLFVSREFKAWAKAERIPFDYANAFFLDSFENLTATEYISRLRTGGPLW